MTTAIAGGFEENRGISYFLRLEPRAVSGIKRKLTVSYGPGGEKPLIRISNKFLQRSGFDIGSNAEIEYRDKVVIITKIS